MTMPALLLGAVLLFWGWQTNLWLLAVPMACALEGARFMQSRWDFSAADYRRISIFCLSLIGLVLVYLLFGNRTPYLIYTLLQWLPPVFFPLVVAHTYAVSDHFDARSLFLSQSQSAPEYTKPWWIDLKYLYFVVCIFAASAANRHPLVFYGGMVVLSGVALWFIRPRRSSAIAWFALFILATGTGFVGHIGLHQLHLAFEQRVVEWLTQAIGQSVNPIEKSTSIGDVGRLKQSNGIVFRVKAPAGQSMPLLLREAAYNKYQSSTWIAMDAKFTELSPMADRTTWPLGESLLRPTELSLTGTLENGKGLLRLPNGAFEVQQLAVDTAERNPYGTVRVEGKPGWLAYQVRFNPERSLDGPPTPNDLLIPEAERPALEEVMRQLDLIDLSQRPPQEIVRRVDTFFLKQFRYSLDLLEGDGATPLSTFLLDTRSGHCEYFAAATALLLRSAGIPTRYATGYSVHEFSPLEQQYIVRSRHAHAWVMVYLDQRWQILDTTPANWRSLEDASASPWQRISDLWSLLSFKLASEIHQGRVVQFLRERGWMIMVALLLFVLVRQLMDTQQVRRVTLKTTSVVTPPRLKAGDDSEFYRIEQLLNEAGLARHPAESIQRWLNRLQQELPDPCWQELRAIAQLHYRYRFDPQGITPGDRAQLQSLSQSWLEQYAETLFQRSSNGSVGLL